MHFPRSVVALCLFTFLTRYFSVALRARQSLNNCAIVGIIVFILNVVIDEVFHICFTIVVSDSNELSLHVEKENVYVWRIAVTIILCCYCYYCYYSCSNRNSSSGSGSSSIITATATTTMTIAVTTDYIYC